MAKAELDRIMAEDIPRMACADDSLVQNADWKDAIEVVNLLDIARLTVEASLAREESRDAFDPPRLSWRPMTRIGSARWPTRAPRTAACPARRSLTNRCHSASSKEIDHEDNC